MNRIRRRVASSSPKSPFLITGHAAPSVWRHYAQFERDYECIEQIGEGTYSRVLLVRNRKRGTLYSLKELVTHDEYTHGELDLLMNISLLHDSVAHYRDRFIRGSYPKPERYCILMDYVDGVDLETFVKDGGDKGARTMRTMLDAAVDGLQFLHARRIAHRDVKPKNMIVRSSDRRIVLIDFGLGCFLHDETNDSEGDVGTANYYSPELVRFTDSNTMQLTPDMIFASDVWALGASFHFACSGGTPVAQFYGRRPADYERAFAEVLNFRVSRTVYAHDSCINATVRAMLTHAYRQRPTAAQALQMLRAPALKENAAAAPAVRYSASRAGLKPVNAVATTQQMRQKATAEHALRRAATKKLDVIVLPQVPPAAPSKKKNKRPRPVDDDDSTSAAAQPTRRSTRLITRTDRLKM